MKPKTTEAVGFSAKSTNVRSETTPFGWRALGAALRGLHRIAPDAAAAQLERLLLWPPRHAAPERERRALAQGTPFTVRFQTRFVAGRLQAWHFGDEGPIALLVHGWGGRGGQLASFIGPLRAAGYRVVTFDGPGHGRSEGRKASLPHFAAAIRAVAAAVGGVDVVVAHSVGAAATSLALHQGLEVGACVLVGTPRSPRAFIQGAFEALQVPAELRQRTLDRFRRNLGIDIETLDLPTLAPRLGRTPALFVHDRDDAEVPFDAGAASATAWPGAALFATRGLGHRRILRTPEVIETAVRFLSDRTDFAASQCVHRTRLGRGRDCDACRLDAELFQPDLRWAMA